jgi:hypothetical protein
LLETLGSAFFDKGGDKGGDKGLEAAFQSAAVLAGWRDFLKRFGDGGVKPNIIWSNGPE